MEWNSEITTLIAVLIGWFLNQATSIFSSRKENKRKLNKLLYFLLELRYQIDIIVDKQNTNNLFFKKYLQKIKETFQIDILDSEIEIAEQFFSQVQPPNIFNEDDDLTKLKEKVEVVLNELSEVYPILSYELRGLENIHKAINNKEDYQNIQNLLNQHNIEQPPFKLEDLYEPIINDQVIRKLDESIDLVSKKIGKKSNIRAKEKLNILVGKSEDSEKNLDDIINSLVERMKFLSGGKLE